jgi:hypothetical protein
MARKPYKPTKKHIETVRALKKKGATDKACAEAIGITPRTFRNYKNSFFSSPIKKGNEDRIKTHLELAQDALALRLQQRTVQEKTTITRSNENGTFQEEKIQEKVIQPSDTLIMFTLVNKSEGEYQSINKVDNTIINNNNEGPALKLEWTNPKE